MHSEKKTIDQMLENVSLFDMIDVVSNFKKIEQNTMNDQEYVENVIKENVSLKKRIQLLRRRNDALLGELGRANQNTTEIIKKRLDEKRTLLDEIKSLRSKTKDEGEVGEVQYDDKLGLEEVRLENENLKLENQQLKEKLVTIVERAEQMKSMYLENLKKFQNDA